MTPLFKNEILSTEAFYDKKIKETADKIKMPRFYTSGHSNINQRLDLSAKSDFKSSLSQPKGEKNVITLSAPFF